MEFFVDFKLHNSENDGWAFKTVMHTDNYDEALKRYHTECATYIATNPFDHCLIILSDKFGNILDKTVWTAPAPEPKPEPEPEPEETEE